MNYGIVGLGKQGYQHLLALQALSRLEEIFQIFVCDIDQLYIEKISKELGIKGYFSCVDMLKNNKIDVLILALPNDRYREILELPELRDISIIKEKPFATNREEANYFIQLMDQKSVRFNIVQNRFFASHYNISKKWLTDGLIGKILFFEYRYTLNDKKESWYWNPMSGGGCWINIGWHFAFIIEWFFGTPSSMKVKKIKSSKRGWEYNTDDTVFIDCEYPGFTGTGYLSVVDSFKEDSFKIVGASGTIYISKEEAKLIDNDGDVKYKERSENLLSYMDQVKNIFKDGQYNDLFACNVRAMEIINNNT